MELQECNQECITQLPKKSWIEKSINKQSTYNIAELNYMEMTKDPYCMLTDNHGKTSSKLKS
jgi:hypothetical protein